MVIPIMRSQQPTMFPVDPFGAEVDDPDDSPDGEARMGNPDPDSGDVDEDYLI